MGFSKVLAGINAGTRAALSMVPGNKDLGDPRITPSSPLYLVLELCPVDFA